MPVRPPPRSTVERRSSVVLRLEFPDGYRNDDDGIAYVLRLGAWVVRRSAGRPWRVRVHPAALTIELEARSGDETALQAAEAFLREVAGEVKRRGWRHIAAE